MARAHIDKDEWYPVYFVSTNWGEERDVPEETLARWAEVDRAFALVQDEMRAVYEGRGEASGGE